MNALTRKRKVLFGVLAIVAVGWLVDALFSVGRPSVAQAKTGASDSAALEPIQLKAAELAPLIAALSGSAPESVPESGVHPERDPFSLPASFGRVIDTALAAAPPALEDPSRPPVAPAPPFEQCHSLQGIIAGPTPLALIDGELMARGDRVDGAELIDIQRDYAVFDKDGQRILLTLTARETP
ncbi:MAG: hypothetical protein JXO22_11090 [Phycisphaerae bacterium]|nr:hypothetical protein [Phycisphaerae bacterium]